MLTINNPGILSELENLPCGLVPMRKLDGNVILLIKCPKETILTARVRREFRLYLAPVHVGSFHTYGIVTAFFDDDDEPLAIRSPLVQDEMATDLLRLFSLKQFEVHFFDEHNRELLGYHALNRGALKDRLNIDNIVLGSPSCMLQHRRLAGQCHDEMLRWFANRSSADDDGATSIELCKPLFPEDLYIQDSRPGVNSYHGRRVPMHTTLERQDPGHFGELDIVHALLRAFAGEQIYLNPVRPADGREFADVLVCTPSRILVIQAKDSPNTEAMLNRSIGRKKATAVSHLEKAIGQMRGSISYATSGDSLEVEVDSELHAFALSGRELIGLAVVRELFSDEFQVYSPLALELYRDTGVPCFILDYPELHQFTLNRNTEESFFETLQIVLEVALRENEFPRVRFWPHWDAGR